MEGNEAYQRREDTIKQVLTLLAEKKRLEALRDDLPIVDWIKIAVESNQVVNDVHEIISYQSEEEKLAELELRKKNAVANLYAFAGAVGFVFMVFLISVGVYLYITH